ncbi:MAG: PorT family protein [Bacteroidetes bacterium]|nr:PorT family protein [Bacteroidota bacterium]
MKKFIIVSFIVLFISSKVKAQQRFNAGIKAGLSTSQVAGDNYSGFDKAGFVGGFFVRGLFNEKWTGQFEIIYIQKGSRHNANPEKGDFTYYYLGLDYIEVPVLFQYHQKKITYELGPGFSYLLREREFLDWQNLSGIRPFNKNEISINMGISYTIFDNFYINWRFTNSLSSIRNDASGSSRWFNRGKTNIVVTFSLIYQFTGGKSE